MAAMGIGAFLDVVPLVSAPGRCGIEWGTVEFPFSG